MLPCSFRWNYNISACFDESLSWSADDWSCSTLGFIVADFNWLQQYRRKQQCHGVFAWLVWALDITEVLETLLNMSIYAGALGFLPASAFILSQYSSFNGGSGNQSNQPSTI